MRPYRAGLALAALCLAAAVACGTPGGTSSSSSSRKGKDAAGKGPTVSKYGHGKITAAQTLMEEEKDAEAKTQLEALLQDSKLNAYELAVVNRLLVGIYLDADQYDPAIASLVRARDANALSENEQRDVEKSIGQVYLQADKPAQAVQALEVWYAKLAPAQATDTWLVAQAYAQIDEDPKAAARAIELAKQAIDAADPVRPEWIEFLASLYQMNDQESEVIVLLEGALQSGKLQPSERVYQRLAQSYVGMDQEPKALPYLEKAAALATHGRLDLWMAQLQLDAENFVAAEAAANQALRKGGLPDEGQVHYLLGICQFNLKQKDAAKASFNKVANHPRLGKSAAEYLKYIARGLD